jgi:fido (protein-threonine AMPylation protein)
MDDINQNSHLISIFHGRKLPEPAALVGYSALIHTYDLIVPIPYQLSAISTKHRKYVTDQWQIFTTRHFPGNELSDQLTFTLKYEPLQLVVLKKLFEITKKEEITNIIKSEPTGLYKRKIWFLYEWLMGVELDIPDLETANFIDLVNADLQYTGPIRISRRHRVRNNLPGTVDFCPMIQKTKKLEAYLKDDLSKQIEKVIGKTHKDVLARAAAFLLLKDSKASYAIEGERPPQNRAQRWGKAIGQAGQKPLSNDELVRLQQIVIDNPRFVKMGFRQQEGFVGEHDRSSGVPIPDHISAKFEDLPSLMNGVIDTSELLQHSDYDPILTAATIAFGFLFIHPFVDGNGRIHRYLIHDVLIRKEFVSENIIFPVSAVMLERLSEYRKVLEEYSHPVLECIDWKSSSNNNVEVLNDTIDLYKYFDATKQAEFLYDCVHHTIVATIPEEVEYLKKYDLMKNYLDDVFQMPSSMVDLLIRFLNQGNGVLSKRAREKEFAELTDDEIKEIEDQFNVLFNIT